RFDTPRPTPAWDRRRGAPEVAPGAGRAVEGGVTGAPVHLFPKLHPVASGGRTRRDTVRPSLFTPLPHLPGEPSSRSGPFANAGCKRPLKIRWFACRRL